ncbi:unnamed protein product [Cutaneotrichosporon oleaginosum]
MSVPSPTRTCVVPADHRLFFQLGVGDLGGTTDISDLKTLRHVIEGRLWVGGMGGRTSGNHGATSLRPERRVVPGAEIAVRAAAKQPGGPLAAGVRDEQRVGPSFFRDPGMTSDRRKGRCLQQTAVDGGRVVVGDQYRVKRCGRPIVGIYMMICGMPTSVPEARLLGHDEAHDDPSFSDAGLALAVEGVMCGLGMRCEGKT